MTIRIKYLGYSADYSHPADRRRIGILKDHDDIEFVSENDLNFGPLVLSNHVAIHRYLKKKSRHPVIIDIVDAYLALENVSFKDLMRNLMRSFSGRSNIVAITYKRYLVKCIRIADACVAPSPEIADLIRPYNSNVHVITDCHREFNAIDYGDRNSGILWEGFGSNLKHLISVAKDLDTYLVQSKTKLFVVTEKHFFRWGNRWGKIETKKLISRHFPRAFPSNVELVDWSIENLREVALKSRLAIIPIRKDDKFAELKSENKLLELWSIGLPVIVSRTPSYRRVMNAAFQSENAVPTKDLVQRIEILHNNFDQLLNYRESGIAYVKRSNSSKQLIDKWISVVKSVS